MNKYIKAGIFFRRFYSSITLVNLYKKYTSYIKRLNYNCLIILLIVWQPFNFINAQKKSVTVNYKGIECETGVFSDKTKRCSGYYGIKKIPLQLTGLNYVTVPRGDSLSPGKGYQFEINKPADIYLLVHVNGNFDPGDGWERWDKVPGSVVWKDNNTILEMQRKNEYDIIFRKRFSKGTVTVPPHNGSIINPAEPENKKLWYGVPHLAIVADTGYKIPSYFIKNPLKKAANSKHWAKVLVSQYGYDRDEFKYVVYKGKTEEDSFYVLKKNTFFEPGQVVYKGKLQSYNCDFDTAKIGYFTDLKEEGEFQVRIGKELSHAKFQIKKGLFEQLQIASALHYFSLRRIGENSIVGAYGDTPYACQWDKAMTPDKKGWRYLGTSWADGNDIRVYPSTSLVVAQLCMLKETNPAWDVNDLIYDQVRWGLDGVLSMLEKNGELKYMLCSNCFSQMLGSDGVFQSGDETHLIPFNDHRGTSNEYHAFLNHEVVQSYMLLGPAEAVNTFYRKDPQFFERVKKLVVRGYNRFLEQYPVHPQKYSLAAWVWLNTAMYKMTKEEKYKETAIKEAKRWMEIQVTENYATTDFTVKGWYRRESGDINNPQGEKPEQEVMITPWIYQGMFRLINTFPEHEDASKWKNSVKLYAKDYLAKIASLNVYGWTPMKVGKNGLSRNIGNIEYSYFAQIIGRTFHHLGNAAYLMKAAHLLGDKELKETAWKQLYGFVGLNPIGIGFINGFSHNEPRQEYAEKYPIAKQYPGGVSNGLRGGLEDYFDFKTFEYYTYANLNCLWMSTELGYSEKNKHLELWPKELYETIPFGYEAEKHPHKFQLRIKGGFRQFFTALGNTQHPEQLEWYVDNIKGGSAESGLISPKGVYTAPYVKVEKKVKIKVLNKTNRQFDETEVLIMPVPKKVEGFTLAKAGDSLLLRWKPLKENYTGYTLWRRFPASQDSVGTVFENFLPIPAGSTSIKLPLNQFPKGTEFLIKGYHMGKLEEPLFLQAFELPVKKIENKIYGYGPESDIIEVK